jgi:phage terminase large subunit GpA-like protein
MAPFQKGILEAYSDPEVRHLSMMSSAQVGKTTLMLIILGYHAHLDPQNIIIVYPTAGSGEKFSKTKLQELFDYSPALKNVLGSNKDKSGGNSLLFKKLPGGSISIASAQSSSDLRSMSCKVVLMDEIDDFGVFHDEGDPVNIVMERSKTFADRKIMRISTPKIKSISKIETAFMEGNQCYFHVPCPHCGLLQRLVWRDEAGIYRLKIPKEGNEYRCDQAYYECIGCNGHISQPHREQIMQLGQWVPSHPEIKDHASFHLSELYSLFPSSTWEQLAKKWLRLSATPEGLMEWSQTTLGEPFEFKEGDLRTSDLNGRVEPYDAEVPYGVGYLTLGADVQGDRLEMTVLGHGRDNTTYVIEHKILQGNPNVMVDQVWDQFFAYASKTFTHESGSQMKISRAFMDSRYATQVVQRKCYRFRQLGLSIYPIKGVASGPTYAPKRTKNKQGSVVTNGVQINVNDAKNLVFGRMSVKNPEHPGFVHFPIREGIDATYFEQLLSEKRVATKFGVEWKKINDSKRNEALDCFVYAFAAFDYQKVDIDAFVDSFTPQQDEDDSVLLEAELEPVSEPVAAPASQVINPFKRPAVGGGFASKLAAIRR